MIIFFGKLNSRYSLAKNPKPSMVIGLVPLFCTRDNIETAPALSDRMVISGLSMSIFSESRTSKVTGILRLGMMAEPAIVSVWVKDGVMVRYGEYVPGIKFLGMKPMFVLTVSIASLNGRYAAPTDSALLPFPSGCMKIPFMPAVEPRLIVNVKSDKLFVVAGPISMRPGETPKACT